MTIVTSGPLALGNAAGGGNRSIKSEFNGSDRLSDYYAGGPYVPLGTTGTSGPIPASGALRVSHFYGASNIYSGTITIGVRAISPTLTYWGFQDSTATFGQPAIGDLGPNRVAYGNTIKQVVLTGSGTAANGLNFVLAGDFGTNPATNNPFSSITLAAPVNTTTYFASAALAKEVFTDGVLRTQWRWGFGGFVTHDWVNGQTRSVTVNPP